MSETPSTTQASAMETATPVEHRQAYGTAKTESLRDSGLWRILLPGFVGVCCLAIVAIALFIPVWLLVTSFSSPESLTWLWLVMILIVAGIAAVIVWGLTRIFMTQAGNYR